MKRYIKPDIDHYYCLEEDVLTISLPHDYAIETDWDDFE